MRKILVFSGYRSEYLKIRSILLSLRKRKGVQLKVVCFGPHMLGKFGETYKDVLEDGFEVDYRLYTNIEGDSPIAMAQSVSSGISQASVVLEKEKPNLVLICGDRYEIFSIATAASLSNVPIAHCQGGEVTGTIDESLRHAITKLAHIHFPATELSRQRIIRMGEEPSRVFNFGCPFVDYANEVVLERERGRFLEKHFVNLDSSKPFGIVVQHSVTTEFQDAYRQMLETLRAVEKLGVQVVLVWPNSDPGSEMISKAVRDFKANSKNSTVIDAWRTIKTEIYMNLLFHSSFIVGNSSSGIREAHLYGVPAINIGNRQNGRERTKNVIDVPHSREAIYEALKRYSGERIYDENVYGNGTAGEKIAQVLEAIKVEGICQKKLIY